MELCKCTPEWLKAILPVNCAGCGEMLSTKVESYVGRIGYPCFFGRERKTVHLYNLGFHTPLCYDLFIMELTKNGRIPLIEVRKKTAVNSDELTKLTLANHTLTGRKCMYCNTAEQSHCKFGNCGGCMHVKYCNKECLNKDWKKHKKTCDVFIYSE